MGRLLLLITTRTYRAQAFLEAAGRLGLPLTVGSETPQSLSHADPAGHLTIPFDRYGEALEIIEEFSRRHPIAAVVAPDDECALLAARAAAALGLRHAGVEAVKTARDKHRMRMVLRAAGMRTPQFWRFGIGDDPQRAARRVVYPCVVKPVSLSAGRGVIRADDPARFAAAFSRVASILARSRKISRGAGPADSILVESYIPGTEVALEGLLSRNALRVLALFDKPDPLEGPFFEETIYVTPSRLPARLTEEIVRTTRASLGAIGLSEGPVHVELRLNEEEPWILEIAPRSIGGLCSRTLRFGAGASLEEVILLNALDRPLPGGREAGSAGVMMIPIPKAGILERVDGRESALEVEGIEDLMITIPPGHELVPIPEGSRYLGFIFARAVRPDRVEAALREAHRRLRFSISPLDSRHEAK